MTILWTGVATRKFKEILNYIEREFGQYSREHFKTKTREFTTLLKDFPEIGTLEVNDKKIRGFQLTKQTRVFYRQKAPDTIVILTFFDTRQHPRKKPR